MTSRETDGSFPSDAVIPPDTRPAGARERRLGDFQTDRRALLLAGLCLPIGAVVAVLALAMLDLIGLITNLAYTGRMSTALVAPDVSALGTLSVAIPILGGLAVGLMARFGSERIRGHGIPEAMETILTNGSRMEPRLAVLKPVSAAVSIGTGGPFGAEGPIIVTGGAVGSILGQLMHLTAAERRSLLVAGAAAGMTAVFATPVAAVLLAVELLLFELRPRSLVPVALAVTTAQASRQALAGAGLLHPSPLFPVTAHGHGSLPLSVLAGSVLVGVACAGLAWLMTQCVYGAEDLFGRLPLHWSWWPALGGFVVGLGGLVDSRALGVGYGTIGAELAGHLALGALAALLIVKLVVWATALGSNTSGGVLAPLLMLGAALGGLLGSVLPGAGPWALLGMAAAMAGVMRSPLASTVFALELSHDMNALPALLAACMVAHLISVLLLKRSILTEKVARRGYHVVREYEVDPLRALLVRDVMRSAEDLPETATGGLDATATARADETLREVADRMISANISHMPVLDESLPPRLLGVVGQLDLLKAHERLLIEERRRERPLGVSRKVPTRAVTGAGR